MQARRIFVNMDECLLSPGRPLEYYRRLYWQSTDAGAGGTPAAIGGSPALSEVISAIPCHSISSVRSHFSAPDKRVVCP